MTLTPPGLFEVKVQSQFERVSDLEEAVTVLSASRASHLTSRMQVKGTLSELDFEGWDQGLGWVRTVIVTAGVDNPRILSLNTENAPDGRLLTFIYVGSNGFPNLHFGFEGKVSQFPVASCGVCGSIEFVYDAPFDKWHVISSSENGEVFHG